MTQTVKNISIRFTFGVVTNGLHFVSLQEVVLQMACFW
jgi:hypothetical protein